MKLGNGPTLTNILSSYAGKRLVRVERELKMIYFIKNITNGTIKIGFSDKPNKRLSELQTGSADKLVLIKAIDGDESVEAALHQQFALHRLQGEWFSPAEELIQFIKGKDDRSLEGKFFHTFKNGEIEWQGYVVAQQGDGYFLVQLLEWVLGEPSTQKVVHIGAMADWEFYNSAEEMNEAYERRTGRSGKSMRTLITEAREKTHKTSK